ncbi:MAG: hypothetical protein EZS28_024872, partial [Streblomastix strix]
MNISSVFPEVRFFVVIAHLDHDLNIVLEPVTAQPSPNHFVLLVRYHKQDLDTLRPYFEEELKCYEDLLIQKARHLIYIGCGSTSSGCCTIFLASNTLTLEGAIQQGILSDTSAKLQIAKSLIDSIRQAHMSGHIGFNLLPSAILCTKGNMGLSVALIGFVGEGSIIAKHPDYQKLKWDRDWTAPELASSRPRRQKTAQNNQEQENQIIKGPTVASDIYALGILIQHIFERSSEVQEFVSGVLQAIPSDRCSAETFLEKFIEFQNKLKDAQQIEEEQIKDIDDEQKRKESLEEQQKRKALEEEKLRRKLLQDKLRRQEQMQKEEVQERIQKQSEEKDRMRKEDEKERIRIEQEENELMQKEEVQERIQKESEDKQRMRKEDENVRIQKQLQEKDRMQKEDENERIQKQLQEKDRMQKEDENEKERIRKEDETRKKKIKKSIISNYQGLSPIGWSDELLEEGKHYYFMRVEIIVDYPDNLNISSLTVVDPNNLNLPGFNFVDFEVDKSNISDPSNQKSQSSQSKTDAEMRTAVAVPAFCRNALQVPFFVALESVIPSVAESALHGAFDLIHRTSDNELLKFALRYKDTAIARYSLDALAIHGVSLSAIASKFIDLKITPDDPRSDAAISLLVYFKNQLWHQQAEEQPNEQIKPQPQQQRYSKGFLCDKKNIFTDHITPDTLLLGVFQFLTKIREEKHNQEYAKELLRIGHISERIPRFIATQNAINRLDIVVYALKAGVPLLIQGPTSASKSLTAQVASVGLYGQYPLIYALSEQTEVGDLLGRKMLRRKGTSMLSYVPGVLAEAYEKGRVLLLDEFDLCPPKVISSILSALDGSTIEIEGRKIVRHQNFRVIATLNGETEGFTSQQRNILTSEILSRFHTISFPLMNREECNDIFSQLLQVSNPQYEKESIQIADIHKSVENYYASDQRKDKSRGSAAMTLRNFSYVLDLMVLEKLQPRDA